MEVDLLKLELEGKRGTGTGFNTTGTRLELEGKGETKTGMIGPREKLEIIPFQLELDKRAKGENWRQEAEIGTGFIGEN